MGIGQKSSLSAGLAKKRVLGGLGQCCPAPRPTKSGVCCGLVVLLTPVIMYRMVCTPNRALWVSVQNTFE